MTDGTKSESNVTSTSTSTTTSTSTLVPTLAKDATCLPLFSGKRLNLEHLDLFHHPYWYQRDTSVIIYALPDLSTEKTSRAFTLYFRFTTAIPATGEMYSNGAMHINFGQRRDIATWDAQHRCLRFRHSQALWYPLFDGCNISNASNPASSTSGTHKAGVAFPNEQSKTTETAIASKTQRGVGAVLRKASAVAGGNGNALDAQTYVFSQSTDRTIWITGGILLIALAGAVLFLWGRRSASSYNAASSLAEKQVAKSDNANKKPNAKTAEADKNKTPVLPCPNDPHCGRNATRKDDIGGKPAAATESSSLLDDEEFFF